MDVVQAFFGRTVKLQPQKKEFLILVSTIDNMKHRSFPFRTHKFYHLPAEYMIKFYQQNLNQKGKFKIYTLDIKKKNNTSFSTSSRTNDNSVNSVRVKYKILLILLMSQHIERAQFQDEKINKKKKHGKIFNFTYQQQLPFTLCVCLYAN